MELPDGVWTDEKTGKTAPCRVMALKAYSRTQAEFWYVDTKQLLRCTPQWEFWSGMMGLAREPTTQNLSLSRAHTDTGTRDQKYTTTSTRTPTH